MVVVEMQWHKRVVDITKLIQSSFYKTCVEGTELCETTFCLPFSLWCHISSLAPPVKRKQHLLPKSVTLKETVCVKAAGGEQVL
jgi:hypothetical protein